MDTATVGALCALGSAMSWSVTSLMVSALAPGIGTFTINAARTTLTAVLVVGWMLAAGGLEVILTLSMSSLALLAVSIVLAIAIGDTIFFESTQRLGLGRAMTISMSYPVVAASLAALLLGERLTAPIVVGGLLRSEEHTSELQSQSNLVCRLLLEKKKITPQQTADRQTAV